MNEALIELRDLLEASLGSKIKTCYAGRVGIPAKNYLPALILQEVSTEIERQSSGCDQYRHTIRVVLVMDMVKQFATAGIVNDIVGTHEAVRKLMEEADTDGAPRTDTVLGTIMKQSNIRGTNYVYNLDGVVNYEPTFPGQDQFFYIGAELTLGMVSNYVTRKQ